MISFRFNNSCKRRWKVEHERLCHALESSRYHELVKEWQHALETIRIFDHTKQLTQKNLPNRWLASKHLETVQKNTQGRHVDHRAVS
jgi:hypothetical protein